MNDVVRSSLLSFSTRFIVHLLGFLTIIFLSRLLDSYFWGIFSFAYGLMNIGILLSDAGLSAATIYYSSKKNTRNILSTIFFFKSLLLILVLSVICVFSYIFFNQIFIYVLIASVFGYFFGLWNFLMNVFEGKRQFELKLFFTGMYYSFRFLLSVFFVLWGMMVLGAFFGYILAVVISFILGLFIVKKYLGKLDFTKISVIVRYGVSAGLGNVSGTIFLVADVVLIGVLLSTTYVGYYSISQRIIMFFSGLVASLFSVFFPYFSHWEDLRKIKKYFAKSLEFAFYVSVPLFFFLVLSASDMVKILFGNQYLSSATPIPVLAFMIIDTIFISMFFNIYASQGIPLKFTRLLFLGSVMNLGMNLFFIPVLGILGAAVSTIISRAFVVITGLRNVRHDFRLSIRPGILRPVLFSIISSTVFLLIYNTLPGTFSIFYSSFMFFLTYIVLLYLYGDKEFVDLLKITLRDVLWK